MCCRLLSTTLDVTCSFFAPKVDTVMEEEDPVIENSLEQLSPAQMVDYLSDHEEESINDEQESNVPNGPESSSSIAESSHSGACLRRHSTPPLKKRQCHEIPVRLQRQNQCDTPAAELASALKDIKGHISSKKSEFVSRDNGLQAYHACAIQSYLLMVVK